MAIIGFENCGKSKLLIKFVIFDLYEIDAMCKILAITVALPLKNQQLSIEVRYEKLNEWFSGYGKLNIDYSQN